MKQSPQELFDSFKPNLGNQDRYIEELSKKLDAVEMLHKVCEENARRTRKSVLIAALGGLMLGGLIMAIVLLCPSSGIDFSIKLSIGALKFSIRYAYLALIFLATIPVYLVISLYATKISE